MMRKSRPNDKNDKKIGYDCWLGYSKIEDADVLQSYTQWCQTIYVPDNSDMLATAAVEIKRGIKAILGIAPVMIKVPEKKSSIILGIIGRSSCLADLLNNAEISCIENEGYIIKANNTKYGNRLIVAGKSENGVLYGAFVLLRMMQLQTPIDCLNITENPSNPLRMIDQWDNMDGSIERGYAGASIFYKNNKFKKDSKRIFDYARLLSSIGINCIVINNVNVHETEMKLISEEMLPYVASTAEIFRKYGIGTFLCIDYSSPMTMGKLSSADPLDDAVKSWWKEKVELIYKHIPDFGGFLVKADSEFRPGPFTYGRNHAEGANMLAEALKSYGGLVIWRCFVYNCRQDWRDRFTDRANAAYDNFMPLDGEFADNVILQIKNGPMDFQVREPVSPLFGSLENTNCMLELQITQEYTGQQKHLCYLVPQWKEILDFDTYAKGEGSTVDKIIGGAVFEQTHSGIAAVSNIGDDANWTGHDLAQANLYGFGRLAWKPSLSPVEIAEEWIRLTWSSNPKVMDVVVSILMDSWSIYEKYTSPLGIGWMVNPGHHYGPNVDGYEYSLWGTYHRADHTGMGIDRSVGSGTGYTGRYKSPVSDKYEDMNNCPEELLLFFHRVPYKYMLKSGKTLIQHIYDSHFEGAEQALGLVQKWEGLKSMIPSELYVRVQKRLEVQSIDAREWCDVVNSYFFRKSGIEDEKGRTIY